jgi:threonine dehydratase
MAAELAAVPGSSRKPPVTQADVAAARGRLGIQVRRTPVLRVEADQLTASHPACWLKLESLQCTGAFKARGALNSLLAARIPPAGVCAASGGNHGQAVAWAARLAGVPASVFVPVTCPPVKLRRLAGYGANVTVIGEAYEESRASAEHFAAQTGALLVHPFDQQLTVAGAGTVTAEFSEQVPDLDTILIAVGGGGLLAGALAALEGTSTRARWPSNRLPHGALAPRLRLASRSTWRCPALPSTASACAGWGSSRSTLSSPIRCSTSTSPTRP